MKNGGMQHGWSSIMYISTVKPTISIIHMKHDSLNYSRLNLDNSEQQRHAVPKLKPRKIRNPDRRSVRSPAN